MQGKLSVAGIVYFALVMIEHIAGKGRWGGDVWERRRNGGQSVVLAREELEHEFAGIGEVMECVQIRAVSCWERFEDGWKWRFLQGRGVDSLAIARRRMRKKERGNVSRYVFGEDGPQRAKWLHWFEPMRTQHLASGYDWPHTQMEKLRTYVLIAASSTVRVVQRDIPPTWRTPRNEDEWFALTVLS